MTLICKSCRAGDCPDCINWITRRDGCEHACSDQPHQLALPWVTGTGESLAAVETGPGDSPVPPF